VTLPSIRTLLVVDTEGFTHHRDEPLRAALRDSDPNATFVALIISEETFNRFVRGGYTGLQASRFRKVRARVKPFDQPAFLYVPTPSELERPAGDGQPDGAAPPPAPAGGMSFGNISVSGHRSQSVIGSQGGDIRQDMS
jgi:hypothetical protein